MLRESDLTLELKALDIVRAGETSKEQFMAMQGPKPEQHPKVNVVRNSVSQARQEDAGSLNLAIIVVGFMNMDNARRLVKLVPNAIVETILQVFAKVACYVNQ